MGLEAVTYIDDLNVDWPLSTDKRRQGDDHLRNIKLAIKNTLPNLTEPMTKTAAELNAVPTNLTAVIAEILNHLEPAGSIKSWDLANKPSLPTGWVECNGQTVVGYGVVPDMRDKFIMARGSTYTHGSSGGAAAVTSGAGGAHTPVVQGHILTAAETAYKDYRLYTWETGSSSDANNFGTVFSRGVAGNTSGTFGYRATTNAGDRLIENPGTAASAHTHSADAVGDHTHSVATIPPYYATIFIVKVTEYEAP